MFEQNIKLLAMQIFALIIIVFALSAVLLWHNRFNITLKDVDSEIVSSDKTIYEYDVNASNKRILLSSLAAKAEQETTWVERNFARGRKLKPKELLPYVNQKGEIISAEKAFLMLQKNEDITISLLPYNSTFLLEVRE